MASIIGICGHQRSGKDTSADALVANIPNSVKLSCATPIKLAVDVLFGFSGDDSIKDTIDERWNITPRQAYSAIGNDILRSGLINQLLPDLKVPGKDFYLHRFISDVEKSLGEGKTVVISDVRHQNLVDFIKEQGGIMLRINRASASHSIHTSETPETLTSIDYDIDNNGTISELEQHILDVVQKHCPRHKFCLLGGPTANICDIVCSKPTLTPTMFKTVPNKLAAVHGINMLPPAKSLSDADQAHILSMYKIFPDFPQPGVQYRDISPILRHHSHFKFVLDQFLERYQNQKIDVVAGLESRGFLFCTALGYILEAGAITIRKAGKLPGPIVRATYQLEYGEAEACIQEDLIKPGDRVLIVDDLIATGGTMNVSIDLIRKMGGTVVETCVIAELVAPCFGGRKRVEDNGASLYSLVKCPN